MTAPRRLPVDPGSIRVERWLAERRDATPPPDPGRVLQQVLADLAKSTQQQSWRAAAENLAADQRPYPGRSQWHGDVVALPPATVGIALMASIAIVTALLGAILFVGASMQPPGSEAVAPGAVSASVPAAESTPRPRTVVRTDVLPGVSLEVEEVEPGVLRIVRDGIRDIAWERGSDGRYPQLLNGGMVVAGRDGSVWNITYPASPADQCEDRCTLMYRLGEDATHVGPSPDCGLYGCEHGKGAVVVGDDGALWAIWRSGDGDELRSFDGSEWAVRRKLPAKGELLQVVLDADGIAWASWRTPKGQPRVGRLTDEGWGVLEPGPLAEHGLMAHAFGGVTIVNEDGSLTRVTRPHTSQAVEFGTAVAGSVPVAGEDGSYWWLSRTAPGLLQLIRFDGFDSTAYAMTDELQYPHVLGVATDGAVWLRSVGLGCFSGVARFDGAGWTRYLHDVCPTSVSSGEGGTVWVQGVKRSGPVETYVIRSSDAG